MTKPVTHISTHDASSVTIRGKDLVNDLIGERTYTEVLYFLLTDRFPEPGEVRILDACLVTLMEHGFTPSSLVTRLIIDNISDHPQVAIGAGLLALGNVFVGTIEDCARILHGGGEGDEPGDAYCRRVVAEHRAAKRALPGFGHPFHKPDDPRTQRLLEIGEAAGIGGTYVELLLVLGAEVDRNLGRHLPINATGAIAALLLEIGLPLDAMRGIGVVSRAGGLIGHVIEEKANSTARFLWDLAEKEIPYAPPPGQKSDC